MSRTTGPLVLLTTLALAVPTGAAAGEDDGLPHALPPARGGGMVDGGAAAGGGAGTASRATAAGGAGTVARATAAGGAGTAARAARGGAGTAARAAGGGAATARASARAPLPARWMLIARPTPATARVARAFAAEPLRLRGTYVVATARARALAVALRARGLLRGAEPDIALRRASADEADPFGYARGTIVAPTLTPPAAFAPIGLVDDVVDASVPDVAQAKVIAASPGKVLNLSGDAEVAHGTEVASVAAGRADGQGVIGVAPGAPLLSFGYKTMSCAEVSDGILALADAGAKVINLSFEAAGDCHALRLATAAAFGEGVVVVAAAGNDGDKGNPIVYPAAYPHVLTVGSLDLGLAPAVDSSSGRDLDLAAPGEAIPVALPPALDRDGTADGLTRNSGTSFAAPMVSGSASWLIAARPNLTAGQYADLLRASAKDVVTPGWDPHTGYGLPDLAAALAASVPAADRGEPDDGIDQVDGTAFAKPDPYVTKPVSASVAPVEDPADVHRVRVKAHTSILARVTATAPATALTAAAYSGAITTLDNARPLARGRALRLRNATNKPKTYYIVVRAPDGAPRRPAATRYTLTLRKG